MGSRTVGTNRTSAVANGKPERGVDFQYPSALSRVLITCKNRGQDWSDGSGLLELINVSSTKIGI